MRRYTTMIRRQLTMSPPFEDSPLLLPSQLCAFRQQHLCSQVVFADIKRDTSEDIASLPTLSVKKNQTRCWWTKLHRYHLIWMEMDCICGKELELRFGGLARLPFLDVEAVCNDLAFKLQLPLAFRRDASFRMGALAAAGMASICLRIASPTLDGNQNDRMRLSCCLHWIVDALSDLPHCQNQEGADAGHVAPVASVCQSSA
ncbi:unnamed protein product [Cladocopium goreaui]|uniref:Uncharacterized protein n=1 Tax=Cladocopium goreaui TaxID=2562237 RepID=A0A9P1BHQ6_9DINO|nr:unnamed protein product [Cladocopium goreaui]|mmetsp:Transcript_53681/g.117378  ORF Transcript_53681/g.117378 Transcript_53681/m.117378 type:complete len:202 (-) Transcript_53681:95-700(-)